MPVFGIFALVIALGVLALIPKTHAVMQRRKRLVVILVIAFLAFLFLNPYLFGLPGRIGEMAFVSEVHQGMTKPELLKLADRYGGHGPFNGAINSPPYEVGGNTIVLQFENVITLCVAGGDEYVFYFSANDLLESWRKNGWETAC
ncbi:MAG TPA: hypothetical protein VHT92_10395 [Candidatus Cybelea sp.]|nr:hypothetical protein [Candidatus Cybelea sp.]